MSIGATDKLLLAKLIKEEIIRKVSFSNALNKIAKNVEIYSGLENGKIEIYVPKEFYYLRISKQTKRVRSVKNIREYENENDFENLVEFCINNATQKWMELKKIKGMINDE